MSVDQDWVWSVLTSEPGKGVTIVTPDAIVQYCNNQMAQMVSPTKRASEMLGQNWQGFMPKGWFDEWGPVLIRVAETDRAVSKRGVSKGAQY